MIGNFRHLRLAWPLARRDITARYRGSMVGMAWTLIGPLAMVAIYALVFQGVFQARWPGAAAAASGGGAGFALRLFAGLILFSAFAECATRATRLMQDNSNLVKRVVFPLELLCVALVMQVAVHAGVQVLLLLVLQALFGGGLGPQVLWLAVVLPWTLVLLMAVSLGLAALGCYLRDLQHLVPLAMSGLLFLSPVFYPLDAAPEALRVLLAINPLSAPIEAFRAACFGDALQAASLPVPLVGACLALWSTRWLFLRLRHGFADLV